MAPSFLAEWEGACGQAARKEPTLVCARNQADANEGFFETLLDFVGKGKVALLQAYFDESQRRSGLMCVAGYAFAPQQARKLTKEFRDAFGPYGGFHMVDLVAKSEGFKGISDAERHKLIKRAVDIVKRRFSYGVAVTVNIAEYDAQAPRFIRGMGNAYPFLCHMAMVAMATLAQQHNDAGPITYVFEAGHAHEAEARHAITQVSSSPEAKQECLYSGCAFLPKPDAVPLQSADLLAWESGKFQEETYDVYIRSLRRSLRELWEAAPSRYAVAFLGGQVMTRNLEKFWQLGIDQMEEDIAAKGARAARLS